MKTTLLILTSILTAPALLALSPPETVPDSGGSAGLIALALVAVFAVRRAFRK